MCSSSSSSLLSPTTSRTFNPADYTSETRTGTTHTEVWDAGANGTNPDGTGKWH